MKKNWNVEIRENCKICGKKLPNKRWRTYCSDKCRNKRNNRLQARTGYNMKRQREIRDEIASKPDPRKCQCLICGKWYVQVCSHTFQIHGMTGRNYREYFELEVKRGIVPEWYRKLKGDIAIDNETYKNLRKGAKFRFKKGQKGVGVYQRSPVTINRLKKIRSLKKS